MDFALIMFLALVVTGVIWALDRFVSAPRRERKAKRLREQGAPAAQIEKAGKEPLIVEYARAFFPVILIVFLLRSFLVEPFRIPSGSMLPTLLVGDFILVNKFAYGVRLPIVNKKIVDIRSPQRGDVMVFRFPQNPSDNYIKRVIGLPGDRIVYKDKELFINGDRIERLPAAGLVAPMVTQYREQLDQADYTIMLSGNVFQDPMEFVVEPGHYFVMGDNRDHSNDSRYWGSVPEENLVGEAFFIWFSWDAAHGGGINWKRIGMTIQ